jgi:hypothetical protein
MIKNSTAYALFADATNDLKISQEEIFDPRAAGHFALKTTRSDSHR